MSSVKCNIPQNPEKLPNPQGKQLDSFKEKAISDLKFPRRINIGEAVVYSGNKVLGRYNALENNIEVLAPNVIKVTFKGQTTTYYNVSIAVQEKQ